MSSACVAGLSFSHPADPHDPGNIYYPPHTPPGRGFNYLYQIIDSSDNLTISDNLIDLFRFEFNEDIILHNYHAWFYGDR